MNTIKSINPSNKQILGQVEFTSNEEIVAKVKASKTAAKKWKNLGLKNRIAALRNVVSNFSKYQDEFSVLISQEMGMPISQSRHEIPGAIDYFNWYLDNAEEYLSPEIVYEDENMLHEVTREPYGVVAAITPWNFPASNVVWMIGQNLIVGNTIIFKDSEEVPLCGKLIEKIFNESNLPEGVFSEIYGDGNTGKFLLEQDIDAICFTGSTKTGYELYKVAAKKFIKVFLELGGSAPGIVFQDADLDKVLDTIYANRFDNCGQICDGLKRLIVHESLLDECIEKLQNKLEAITIGDASDESTDIGPLVSEKQLLVLNEQVENAISKGANIIYKKKIPDNLCGFFYAPTLLININKNMKVWNEEVFGPVLPIVTFKTEDEAIELANDTKYGLGGYIFTEDKNKFTRVAQQINSGMIQNNNAGYVQPQSPFGGYKRSGIGREHGKYGFHELSQIKLVSYEK